MQEPSRVRTLLFFCIRFIVLAPLVLAAWWSVMPYYVSALGHTCAWFMRVALHQPIEGIQVSSEGVLNTAMTLGFISADNELTIEVSLIVTNIAPFVALLLATPGLAFRRRMTVLAIGSAILILGHALYLVLGYVCAPTIAQRPEVPMAAAELSVMLPFLLWIVMAYWDRIAQRMFSAQADDQE